MEIIFWAKLVFLQYSSLAAQYSSPGQQNHPALGQHPPGHTVPSQSCFTIFLGAAMEISQSCLTIFLQYSSLAAQYSSPGQQNHPALGQQPPGHTVPSQSCLTIFLAAAMEINLSAMLVFFTVFFTGGTVFISRTAEPSGVGAAASWTYGTFTVLFGIFGQPLGCSHGNHFVGEVDFLAVFFTGCAVFISGAAEPSGVGAATAWTYSTITVLFYLFQLPLRCSHSNKFVCIVGFLAVFFAGCAVFISRTAEPSGIR